MSREAEDAALAFLLRLDPATQREVLERFEEVMQAEPLSHARNLRRVAAAFFQAKRTLGRSPSVREYKRLRRKHPEWGWPDPRSVTRWLGVRGWNDALVRMRLEPVLEGDVVESAIGPTYSIDEAVQAVRDCATDLGRPPTVTDYLAWQRRPDVRDRPGRRPACTWVFNRIFGGFQAARVSAGLVAGEPTDAHPSDFYLRTANYRIKDEQILDDIRFAATRITGALTATSYDRERRLVYQETRAAGRPRALAGVGTIYRHFRSWHAALDAAGIEKRYQLPTGRFDRSGSYSRDALMRALSEAYDATGDRFTVAAYSAWRSRQLECRPARDAELPGYITIWRRLGGWLQVVEQMHEWRRTTGHARQTLQAIESDNVRRPPVGGPAGPTFSTEQLLRVLSEAQRVVEGNFTVRAYLSWRDEVSERDPGKRMLLPSSTTIVRRFRGWPNALARMHEWRECA